MADPKTIPFGVFYSYFKTFNGTQKPLKKAPT
jgi:hypothetical protein